MLERGTDWTQVTCLAVYVLPDLEVLERQEGGQGTIMDEYSPTDNKLKIPPKGVTSLI